MKTTINIFLKPLIFLAFVFCFVTARAQEESNNIKSLIEAKQFVFKAQTALPASMSTRQLSGDNYDLKLFGDSLVSYLPYFGRAYTAPVPGSPGGYNFTSTKFEFTAKERKKGGWDIIIKPEDVTDFREFSLLVSKSGSATLRALSNNRQMISYNGYITEVKK
jgi:hypothetical protein